MDALRTAVQETLQALVGYDANELDDALELVADLGVDSFALVELVDAIERKLQLRLPSGVEGRVAHAITLGELLGCLRDAIETIDASGASLHAGT